MTPRAFRRLVVGLLVLAAMAGVGITGGCASSSLPPRPSAAELERLKATHFRATVGVERARHPVYSERLAADLRRSGLFDAVDELERLPQATLIARVERFVHGTATLPLATLLTLGVVPTTVEEEHGHVFSLRAAAQPQREVRVDFVYRGPSTLGWWAVPLNLFAADRTPGDPRAHERFRSALAVALSERAQEISALAAAPAPR